MEDQDKLPLTMETAATHQATHQIKLQCISCKENLKKPVQLSECLHIICFPCLKDLKPGSKGTVVCPQCHVVNTDPKILHRISGINLKSPDNSNKSCDSCLDKLAQWNCFDCGSYLCGSCRAHHQRDHALYLLQQPQILLRPTSPIDEPDSQSQIICPLCKDTRNGCSHTDLLSELTDPVSSTTGFCTIPTHLVHGEEGNPAPLLFFCSKDADQHWRPVCGICSEQGLLTL